MRRLLTRLAGAAAAAGLATAGLVAAALPAEAAACSGTSGVTVVVDFGGSTTVACAPGDPTSGLDALAKAGFSVTQVQTQPGFVCRINGSPSSDPCRNTPPASAYWAYHHAARGGSWSYSTLGAGSYDPKPGSVEGWSFGSGGAPGTAPPAPTATTTPKPSPTPTKTSPKPVRTLKSTTKPRTSTSTPPPAATGSKTSASGSSGSASPSASSSASASPSATASGSASPSASGSASAGASPGASPSDGPTTLAAEPVSRDGSGGGAGTLLAGGALVALVAVGAGWTVWRRRTG